MCDVSKSKTPSQKRRILSVKTVREKFAKTSKDMKCEGMKQHKKIGIHFS